LFELKTQYKSFGKTKKIIRNFETDFLIKIDIMHKINIDNMRKTEKKNIAK